jgi:hypothetical protein
MKHIWLYITKGDVDTERRQCEEDGRDLTALREQFDRVEALDLEDLANQPEAEALLDAAINAPQREGYEFDEPSDLDGILARRPAGERESSPALSDSDLEDRVYGAWTGRCVGCLLGKPVEGWRRERMWGYLHATGRWPLSDFFRYDAATPEVRERYDLREGAPFGDRVAFMPEDDDTNYTTTGLAIMERFGPGFTPTDVANFWMSDIPLLHTCTAERVAYRNFARLIAPPASATFRNPYREWIGAQIRADFWGYAAPGVPEQAARMAWRDACISHVKNGIYGEMWAAAMVSAAFIEPDPVAIIRAGLAQIPSRSRLARSLAEVLDRHAAGVAYDDAVETLHREWNEAVGHDWCHTISNAIVVALGLLYSEGDFATAICRAVQPGFDTDCNGATVGSIMGAALGRRALPRVWAEHIHDTLHTGVAGYHTVKLADITRATLRQIERVASA